MIIDRWSQVLEKETDELEETLTVPKLAAVVAKSGCLKELGCRLELSELETEIDWLNAFLELTVQHNPHELLSDFSILPNQEGKFMPIGKLTLDSGIDESIKDICGKLGEPVRPLLLDTRTTKPVRQLFEGVSGRTLTTEACIDKALKRVREHAKGSISAQAIQGNAELLHWLTEGERLDQIQHFPVFCLKSNSELTSERPLLRPRGLWPETAQPFWELFPGSAILDDRYADVLQPQHWNYLESKTLIHRKDLLCEEVLESLDPTSNASPDLLDDQKEHTLSSEVFVTQIAYLRTDDGLLETVRKAKSRTREFVDFILSYVIKIDGTWDQMKEVNCSCNRTHFVRPGWMQAIMQRQWVYEGKNRQGRPTPGNIAPMLDENLKKKILGDEGCAKFLDRMGIGVSDLLRWSVQDSDTRIKLDRVSAMIYGLSEEPSTLASVEAILEDPDMREMILAKKEDKEKIQRNQHIGRTIEAILKRELESEGITVQRTGRGSDYEIAYDFVEDGQRQLLQVTKFLVEVKGTSESQVRMTITQGKEATYNEERYVLCVVALLGGITEDVVRANARFVMGIGRLLKGLVNDASNLKEMEEAISAACDRDLAIEIFESKIRFRVSSSVWAQSGVGFDEFVTKVKNPLEQQATSEIETVSDK